MLLDALPAQWDHLLSDLERGTCRHANDFPVEMRARLCRAPRPARANELRAANPAETATLWPRLRVISCWAEGAAAPGAVELSRRFPRVFIQAKGLIASEAFVTLPFGSQHPLAVCSHFYEFIDVDGRVHLPEAVQQGGEYEVVVSTSGGLWRYRLGDRVIVNGFVGQTPSLRFIDRVGNVSDRFGEKLSEAFVQQALREVLGAADESSLRFALLAPDEDAEGCRYTLYIEGPTSDDLAEALDRTLFRNPHYSWCRELGQLKVPRVFMIKTGGYEAFVARQARPGTRMGDIKPAAMSRITGWSRVFTGTYAD